MSSAPSSLAPVARVVPVVVHTADLLHELARLFATEATRASSDDEARRLDSIGGEIRARAVRAELVEIETTFAACG